MEAIINWVDSLGPPAICLIVLLIGSTIALSICFVNMLIEEAIERKRKNRGK